MAKKRDGIRQTALVRFRDGCPMGYWSNGMVIERDDGLAPIMAAGLGLGLLVSNLKELKTISIADLCNRSDGHPDQLLMAAVRKQEGYSPKSCCGRPG
jgi:hypothetical protein